MNASLYLMDMKIMMKRSKPNGIPKIQLEGDTREIIVIGPYPFYKSTGANSGMAGTWLPFLKAGIPMGPSTGELHKVDTAYMYEMWKEKPELLISLVGGFVFNDPSTLSKDEQSIFLKFLHATKGRLGNIETILISYFLGGGLWGAVDEKDINKRAQCEDVFNMLPLLEKEARVSLEILRNKLDFEIARDPENAFSCKNAEGWTQINDWINNHKVERVLKIEDEEEKEKIADGEYFPKTAVLKEVLFDFLSQQHQYDMEPTEFKEQAIRKNIMPMEEAVKERIFASFREHAAQLLGENEYKGVVFFANPELDESPRSIILKDIKELTERIAASDDAFDCYSALLKHSIEMNKKITLKPGDPFTMYRNLLSEAVNTMLDMLKKQQSSVPSRKI